MSTFFKTNDISPKAVNEFFAKQNQAGNEIHCIKIYKDGKIILDASQNPYDVKDKRELYSLSKTFTSTSIGIASDMGLLKVDEKIIDIFPDKCPENISENLAKMTVSHVLSMNTGHAACVMPKMYLADDSVKAFLEQPVEFEPGTHFTYNTGATCLLGAIIKKRSGLSLFDFAQKHLFDPLGIKNAYWNKVKDTTDEGGVGLHVSCDNVLKLGIMYLNNGVYDGKRVLSENWVKLASSSHSDNSTNGRPDWCAGYGYQIWMNDKGGYRADGAFGQLCLVLPQYNAVVAAFARCRDMQKEIDFVFDLLQSKDKSDEPLNALGFDTLGTSTEKIPFEGKTALLCDNPIGFESVSVKTYGDELEICFNDGICEQILKAGNGEYVKSSYNAKYRKPKLCGMMRADFEEILDCAACYTVSDGVVEILVRFLNSPNIEVIKLYCENNKLNIDFLGDPFGGTVYPDASKVVEK